MENFNENLKYLIEDSGLSLRKLAKESGVSAMQYSRYLHGSIPTIDITLKIANYFNCSLDYLFGLTNTNNYKNEIIIDINNFVFKYEELLKQSKISHWKFAKKYNLSESCLRHWKYGQVPKMESILLIATNLNTSIDYLISKTK
ncbi:MAG: helix-turn-helix transcriptional regulator [Clostridia bacterium]|nr:helix-turn-helix transcriptional regulator [Clostridia bacterium]